MFGERNSVGLPGSWLLLGHPGDAVGPWAYTLGSSLDIFGDMIGMELMVLVGADQEKHGQLWKGAEGSYGRVLGRR